MRGFGVGHDARMLGQFPLQVIEDFQRLFGRQGIGLDRLKRLFQLI